MSKYLQQINSVQIKAIEYFVSKYINDINYVLSAEES